MIKEEVAQVPKGIEGIRMPTDRPSPADLAKELQEKLNRVQAVKESAKAVKFEEPPRRYLRI